MDQNDLARPIPPIRSHVTNTSATDFRHLQAHATSIFRDAPNIAGRVSGKHTMRGLKRGRSARVIIRGHALMQNIRRGHYELGTDARHHRRIESVFTELARTI